MTDERDHTMIDTTEQYKRPGLGELMQLMILVLLVAVITLFLYDLQTRTGAETVDALTDAGTAYEGHVILQNLHDLDLIVPHQANPDLVQVLIYACDYGDEEEGYEYTVSPTAPIQFQTEEDIEAVLDETMHGSYYLDMECEGDRHIQIGDEPPADAEILVAPVQVPLPRGGTTTAYLHQWQ